MTQEDKSLLLQDLCSRLPYEVMCHIKGDDTDTSRKLSRIEVDELDGILLDFWTDREDYLSIQVYLSEVKPYLRPMSSMTEEEKKEFETLGWRVDELDDNFPWPHSTFNVIEGIDWLTAHYFDFRNLIERGLAIDCTGLNIY